MFSLSLAKPSYIQSLKNSILFLSNFDPPIILTKFLDVEKTNQSDNLASYFDLTFTVERDGNLSSNMTDVMTLISALSIFHSCQIIYHLAP